jgi:hypothetical protein
MRPLLCFGYFWAVSALMLPSTLTRWDLQVAEEYKLRPETLFIAVNYIDRFLAKSPVQRGKLQLVGITAMLIAAYARTLSFASYQIFLRRINSRCRLSPLVFAGSTRRSTLL